MLGGSNSHAGHVVTQRMKFLGPDALYYYRHGYPIKRGFFHTVDNDQASREVCICEDRKAKYTLFRSMDTLDHDYDLIEGQRDDEFRCLVYAPDPKIDNQRVAFHRYGDLRRYHAPFSEQVSDKLVLARFVPLGWLRKSSLEAGKEPRTPP